MELCGAAVPKLRDDRAKEITGSIIVLLVIMTIIVILRLILRKILVAKYDWDDFLILVAVVRIQPCHYFLMDLANHAR